MTQLTQSALAAMIDHTLLKADATRAEIEKLCREANDFGFASVCVNPYRVEAASKFLLRSKSKVCTVIGFPLGALSEKTKAFEAREAVERGAGELDMVLNIGALKDGNFAEAEDDIAGVVNAGGGRIVKVILETCLLSDEQIVKACQLSVKAGASFVKTSTGFSSGGATTEHVRMMRAAVGDKLGVKASGGIRDLETFNAMIAAGANRIGTSSGVALIEKGRALEGAY